MTQTIAVLVQEFWSSPRHRGHARPESGRPVRCHPRRPRQSSVDHGDQSGGQPAGRRSSARSACDAANWSSCPTASQHTDTTALAHVLLPAAGWGEKDGTVTNSERRISRQRAFLPAPGEAQAGLVDHLPSRTPPGLTRRPSPSNRRTKSSRSTLRLSGAADSGSARLRHRRSRSSLSSDDYDDCSSRFSGPFPLRTIREPHGC